MSVSAIILAGGKSSRFESDKTLLTINGERIIETLAESCLHLFGEVLIVSNKDEKFGIPGTRELSDRFTGAGPLGGIHAGLLAASFDTAFVTACDMPFFCGELALQLAEYSEKHDVVVPRDGELIQPLFAVYKKSILPKAEALLMNKQRSIRRIYQLVDTFYLDRADWRLDPEAEIGRDIFYNINYPGDYHRLTQSGPQTDTGGSPPGEADNAP